MEKQLKEISGVWEGGAFTLNDYKGRYRVIAEVDDINDHLESAPAAAVHHEELALTTRRSQPR